MVGGKRKAATTVTDEEPPLKLRKTKKNTQGSKVSIPSKKGHESNMFQTPQPAISLDQLPLEVLERLVTFLDVVTTISISVPTVPYSKLSAFELCDIVCSLRPPRFPWPILPPQMSSSSSSSQDAIFSIFTFHLTRSVDQLFVVVGAINVPLFSYYYITFHVLDVLGRNKHGECDWEEAIVTDDMHQGKILLPFICQDVIWCWNIKRWSRSFRGQKVSKSNKLQKVSSISSKVSWQC